MPEIRPETKKVPSALLQMTLCLLCKLYLVKAKSDTYICIIAERSKIVNPSKEKRLIAHIFTFTLHILNF